MTNKEVMQMALDSLRLCTALPTWPSIIPTIEALRAALAQPEPVAVWELQEGGWDTIADRDWMESLPVGTKLYTAQPEKKWVGLTEDDHEDFCKRSNLHPVVAQALAEFLEAKIKENNK